MRPVAAISSVSVLKFFNYKIVRASQAFTVSVYPGLTSSYKIHSGLTENTAGSEADTE